MKIISIMVAINAQNHNCSNENIHLESFSIHWGYTHQIAFIISTTWKTLHMVCHAFIFLNKHNLRINSLFPISNKLDTKNITAKNLVIPWFLWVFLNLKFSKHQLQWGSLSIYGKHSDKVNHEINALWNCESPRGKMPHFKCGI